MIECADTTYRSTLTLPNDASELVRMTQWAMDVCKAACLSGKTAFALQLCLEEAVANIVEHGKGRDGATEIVTSAAREGDRVTLVVEDNGAPFDSTRAAAHRPAASIEEAPVGGLGIHLMRNFASQMEYSRQDDRNRLRLTWHGG